MKSILPNKVAVEYSSSQQCFHVHSLKESLFDGLMSCLDDSGNDYVLIGLFDNDEDAYAHIENITKRKKEIANKTASLV